MREKYRWRKSENPAIKEIFDCLMIEKEEGKKVSVVFLVEYQRGAKLDKTREKERGSFSVYVFPHKRREW